MVSGVGGGVCQVSTTLYNAVINAELEVVERSPTFNGRTLCKCVEGCSNIRKL